MTPADLKLSSTGYSCRDTAFTLASEPQSRRRVDVNRLGPFSWFHSVPCL